jgi:hypothetical protein
MRARQINQLRMRPGMIILVLVLMCLGAFLITVPLPRADSQLIGSDGIGYYAYLPSLWLDRDLDFTDEYAVFFAHSDRDLSTTPFYLQRTTQGVPPNQWSIGPALLWSPFFWLAHLVSVTLQSLGVPVVADGYGYLYQAPVLVGSILFAGLGVWLTFAYAREFVELGAAVAGVVLVVLGGNLIYYMVAEPSMSHGVSAFASALFFFTWTRRRDRDDLLTPLLLGAEAGLMALIRPQDALFLALPLLDRLPAVAHSLDTHDWPVLARWLRSVAFAACAALAVFSVQMFTWHAIYGSFFRSGYAYGGGGFYWLTPKLGEVLFSPERGLFTWHPVFIAALIGLGLIWSRDRRMTVLGFIAVAVQWYVIASWGDWMQGDAFGGRMFIVCTPVFALGLAALIEKVAQRWSWRVVALAGMVLLAWNFLLFVEYRFFLLTARRVTDWYDLTAGRISKPVDLLLQWLR